MFLKDAPELIIVDEAHSCARPQNQKDNQQLRFHLLKALSKDENRHMVMLTATPHSGKDEEFQSLLGLLHGEFETYDLATISTADKKKLASCFIQRKRKNILKWLDENTPFPKRHTEELPYSLSDPNGKPSEYLLLYNDVLKFARGISIGRCRQQSKNKIFCRAHIVKRCDEQTSRRL